MMCQWTISNRFLNALRILRKFFDFFDEIEHAYSICSADREQKEVWWQPSSYPVCGTSSALAILPFAKLDAMKLDTVTQG